MKKDRFILAVIVALLIEVCVFNFANVISVIINDSHDIKVEDELILNEGYDGTNVQWLYNVGLDKKIYNIMITTDTVCNPDFYYTDINGIIQKIQFVKSGNNRYIAKVNKEISGYIGISVYGDVKLQSVTINARTIAFSIARVMAMILIYVAGTFLFSIQKMPDYQIDEPVDADSKKKTVNIDFIRILAGYLITAVHFFLFNNYYEQIFYWGKYRLFAMTFLRIFATTCVPLFMMLSGYLLINKTDFNSEYLRKRVQPFIIYAMFSILNDVVSVWGLDVHLSHLTVKEIILDILSFKHSWYIEFYFGMVLMMPFLNKMWASCSLKEKRILICSLLVITSLSSVINVYNLSDYTWWSQPSQNANYTKLVTDYWIGLYPFLYYFIGAYLREHRVKIRLWQTGILIVAITFGISMYTYWRNVGSTYVWGNWSHYPSIFIVVLTVLIYVFCLEIDMSFLSAAACRFIRAISGLVWGAFMANALFQNMFYPILWERIPVCTDRLEAFFWIVPLICICSTVMSFVMNTLYTFMAHIMKLSLFKRKRI